MSDHYVWKFCDEPYDKCDCRDEKAPAKEKKVSKVSLAMNGKFILAPYQSERVLKAKETNGFAMLAQKTSVVGLKVLVPTKSNGEIVPVGAMAYVKEEFLYTQPWAKAVYESAGIEGKFIIVDQNNVEFVIADNE